MGRTYLKNLEVLFVSLPVFILLAASFGAYPVPFWSIPGELWNRGEAYEILTQIRFPRILLAVIVGAALGASGASLQGLSRNPLADPALIGVTTGAAFGGGLWIVAVGGGGWGFFELPVFAFLGGAATIYLVWKIAQSEGQLVTVTMILAGIALNSLGFAGIGFLTQISDDEQLRTLTFWMLGGLTGSSWKLFLVATPFTLLGIGILVSTAPSLNAMSLGESNAYHLGANPGQVKKKILLGSALCAGSAVAVAGGISFIGLVVPHILRLSVGADNRWVFPGSVLAGGILLLFADLVERTSVAPAEMPVGVITALLGGPFFMWLLIRRRQEVLRVS